MTMTPTNETRLATAARADPDSLRNIPLKELLSDFTDRLKLLATKRVELAKAEIKADLRSEVAMVKTLGIATLCGLLGINTLLVAAVLALATIVPGWAAALIVAAPFLVTGAVMASIGWARRVKNPLGATRASLKEDLQWMKDRLA
ncbi:MAG: phage holin family protein [Vicinamibacteria bacterium]|nr:phage holin family protein [Vicinamibacteria bacterium]